MSHDRERLIKAAARAFARYERLGTREAFLFWYRIEKQAHPGIYSRRSTWRRDA